MTTEQIGVPAETSRVHRISKSWEQFKSYHVC